MGREKTKITKQVITEIIDVKTGELVQEEKTTHSIVDTEPEYIKLYLNCILTLKDLSHSLGGILAGFLKYISYANPDDLAGGQIIYLNITSKKEIAEKYGVSTKRIDQAISGFVRTGIFKRIGKGTFQVNPHIFGKGEWKNIKKIRATFDFNTREITDLELKK